MTEMNLLSKLNLAKTCLASKSPIEVLTNFCFTGEELIAFNGVQASIFPHVTVDAFALPGDAFCKIFSSYSEKNVSISIKKEDTFVEIKAGQNKSKLACLTKEAFVFKMPSLEGLESINLTPNFFEGLEHVLKTVSNDVASPLCGVVFDIKENPYLCSTNNVHIGVYALNAIPFITPIKIFLPKKTCEIFLSFYKKGMLSGTLTVGKDFVVLDFVEALVYSQLPEVDIFKYETIFDRYKSEDFITIPPIKDTIERILSLKGDVSKECAFVWNVVKDVITLSAKSNQGEIMDTYPIVGNTLPDDIRFKLNALLIQQVLPYIKTFGFSNGAFIGKGDRYMYYLAELSMSDENA